MLNVAVELHVAFRRSICAIQRLGFDLMEWGTCNKKLIITVLHNMVSKDAFLEDNHNEAQHVGSIPQSCRVVKKSG